MREDMTDFEATLVWTVRCKCGRIESATPAIRDWFGIWDEEDVEGQTAVEDLELKGWTFERTSYEELAPSCPECSAPTEAEQIADHCRRNNIAHHSINADGSCNMGCC